MSVTLTDTAFTYAAENAEPGSTAEARLRRAFMAGALAALTSKAPRDQLLAECIQFGRAIGTAAERAKA